MAQEGWYRVSGTARSGRRTYNCPTPEWALRKVTDFKVAEYRDIDVTNPAGAALTEADLISIVAGEIKRSPAL